jgi:signal transduction histidine kinase
MIRPISIILFLLFVGITYSSEQTDSLSKVISNGSPAEKLDAMQKMAKILREQNSWKEVLDLYARTLDYIDSVPVTKEEADLLKLRTMMNSAEIHLLYKAEYNSSLDLLIKALKQANTLNDTNLLIEINGLIGVNYRSLEDYNKSIHYVNIALKYAGEYSDTIQLVLLLNEKANVYLYLDDYGKSEELHLEALDLAKKINYKRGVNFISNDLGLLLFEKGEYGRALQYFQSVHDYGIEIKSNRYICATAINIADVYMKLKKYDSAEAYLNLSLDISLRDKLKISALDVYEGLSRLYYSKGQYKYAYQYQKKYFELQDTIFNTEKERQIAEISEKYEAGKKEEENKLLKQQNVIQELELGRGKSRLFFTLLISGIIVVFIVVIVFILYISNLRKKKVNSELERKNEQITLQKNQLVETLKFLSAREKELNEANVTKDKFFSIIAHDIKNPFSSILGFSKLLSDDFDGISKEDQKKYAGIISESSENLYKLLENLLQWSRAQTNRIEFKPETFDLTQLLGNNVALYKNAAFKKEIEIIIDFEDNIGVYADKSMADVVIRNLISNAIKFTKKRGKIEIRVVVYSETVQVGIIDNGVGIRQSEIQKLFRIDSQVKSTGTDNEQGTGLGLIICKEFVERNGGRIWAESTEGKGSGFYFTLPKYKST